MNVWFVVIGFVIIHYVGYGEIYMFVCMYNQFFNIITSILKITQKTTIDIVNLTHNFNENETIKCVKNYYITNYLVLIFLVYFVYIIFQYYINKVGVSQV